MSSGEHTSLDAYEAARAAAGKLKLRAKAKLADGRAEEVFEACVLLHEAARAEERAVRLVDAPLVTRFAARVEQCFCLVDGLDPHGAGHAYARLHQMRQGMAPEAASSLLSRLVPRYDAMQESYADEVSKLRVLKGATFRLPIAGRGVSRVQQEAKRMTTRYPGVAGWWWLRYRLDESSGDMDGAWRALSRARRLEPNQIRFEAASLLAACKSLSPKRAAEYIARSRSRLDATVPELCLMYALAEMQLARDARASVRNARWQRARDAVRTGLSGQPNTRLRNNLRAVELLVNAFLDGQQPSVELLYLAGLSDVAIHASSDVDVAELLTRSIANAA